MKTLFAKCTVTLTTDQVAELNEMIKRNEPMAVEAADDNLGLVKCPVCGNWVGDNQNYCGSCGQKLDTENVAF